MHQQTRADRCLQLLPFGYTAIDGRDLTRELVCLECFDERLGRFLVIREYRKRVATRQDAEAKQTKADEEEKSRARNCELAKSQLAALEAGARMVRLDTKGDRHALDDAEREQAKIESKKAVDSWCK